MKTFFSIAVLIMSFSLLAGAANPDKDIKNKIYGEWKVDAPDAPYDYQEGVIKFYKEDGQDKIKISTTYDVIMGENLKVEGNKITFEFEVEYELCTAKLDYKENKMTGIVETVQGNIPVTLTRKK
ncbi:MAG: hypothetical protein GXO47_09360 [Chlorobi bacterium]|nr:hypothetical protein [Chlorobiota bacterium]